METKKTKTGFQYSWILDIALILVAFTTMSLLLFTPTTFPFGAAIYPIALPITLTLFALLLMVKFYSESLNYQRSNLTFSGTLRILSLFCGGIMLLTLAATLNNFNIQILPTFGLSTPGLLILSGVMIGLLVAKLIWVDQIFKDKSRYNVITTALNILSVTAMGLAIVSLLSGLPITPILVAAFSLIAAIKSLYQAYEATGHSKALAIISTVFFTIGTTALTMLGLNALGLMTMPAFLAPLSNLIALPIAAILIIALYALKFATLDEKVETHVEQKIQTSNTNLSIDQENSISISQATTIKPKKSNIQNIKNNNDNENEEATKPEKQQKEPETISKNNQ